MSTQTGRRWSLPFQIADRLRRLVGDRFDQSQLSTVESLAGFTQTRAAYVAQTALFGYLKTRMGTSFRQHFEDEVFSQVIRDSAAKLFVSCLSDLTVFSVATAGRAAGLSDGDLAGLAGYSFRQALAAGLADAEPGEPAEDIFASFDARVRATDWADMAEGESAFAGSVGDLLRFAPVVDEFKALDGAIVRNSIRFRWRDVREQARRRIDGAAIGDDWRRTS